MSRERWELIAPDWEQLDTLWKNPLPFVLWPVCGLTILAYWLDEALRCNAEGIRIHCDDRPHLVRAWIEKGDYWSKKIEVVTRTPAAEDARVFVMDVLPGMATGEAVVDGVGVIERWFSLHAYALKLRENAQHVIDVEIKPGVWLGPGVVLHPDATLIPPCRIGPRARIGPGCTLGPNVYVGARSIIEEDVEAVDSIVCEDTFIGRHTSLNRIVAQGGMLINRELGVSVSIDEAFIMQDLALPSESPPLWERVAACILWLIMFLPAQLQNLGSTQLKKIVEPSTGKNLELVTLARGPLIVRRASWLLKVAAGRIRLVGVLPRSSEEWAKLEPEVRQTLQRSLPGVFALSDLYDCHDPAEPDEWVHAVYQVGSEKKLGQRQAIRSILPLMFKRPLL